MRLPFTGSLFFCGELFLRWMKSLHQRGMDDGFVRYGWNLRPSDMKWNGTDIGSIKNVIKGFKKNTIEFDRIKVESEWKISRKDDIINVNGQEYFERSRLFLN
jgi:hypothetical protein